MADLDFAYGLTLDEARRRSAVSTRSETTGTLSQSSPRSSKAYDMLYSGFG